MTKLEWKSLFDGDFYEMLPISQLFEQRNTQTDSTVHEPLSVGKGGVSPQLDNVAKSAKTDGRKLVKKGDIVINSRADRRGASGLSSLDGSVSLIYIVLKPKLDRIVPEYAHHLIRSVPFQEEFFRFGTGIHWDLWSTRYDRMAQIRIPAPPLETQQRIADYLDKETGEIDEMIENLEGLVQELNLRRVESITEILENYSDAASDNGEGFPIYSFKHLIEDRFAGDWGSEERTSEVDIPCVRVADFNRETCTVSSGVPTLRSYKKDKIASRLLKTNDILIEKSGGGEKTPVGSAILYTGEDGLVCTNFIEAVRLKKGNDPRFWVFMFRRNFMSGANKRLINQTTGIQNLDLQRFFDQKFEVPPADVQVEIANKLNESALEIDEMISQCSGLIEDLKARRSALITEVVSGRKEV